MISYNFRTFCKEWCDEVRQEIMNYIAYEIGDCVREQYKFDEAKYKLKYRGEYFFKENLEFYQTKYGENASVDQTVFQIYYDEDSRTIFLMYELDHVLRNQTDPKVLTNAINNRLYNNFQRMMQKYHLRIVDYYHYDRYQESRGRHRTVAVPVNIETFSYWKCYDGVFRFISGKNILQNFKHLHNSHPIIKEIKNINSEYNFFGPQNEHNVKEAFSRLQTVYKKYLGYEIKGVPDDQVFVGWMDPYYPHLDNKKV